MVNEVDKLLDSIKRVFSEYDIVKILKTCSQDITNSLIKEKSAIQNNLKKRVGKIFNQILNPHLKIRQII